MGLLSSLLRHLAQLGQKKIAHLGDVPQLGSVASCLRWKG